MEKQPKFIKEFSKELSPEERSQTARDIREKRAEHFSQEAVRAEEAGQLSENLNTREREIDAQFTRIEELGRTLENLSANSVLERIRDYLKVRKLRADLVLGQKSLDELKELQEKDTAQHSELTSTSGEDIPPHMAEAKHMLTDFYERQKVYWAESDYSREDIKKYFSEEYLSSLSVEDYGLLMQRFPGEMVAHVTRQGIRDHVAQMMHTEGEGEFASSFTQMLRDGRLRSPLGVHLVQEEKEKAVADFLKLEKFDNKESALESLKIMTDSNLQESAASYADAAAVHFAAEEVADAYYGSERGNEVFFAFPTAHIASQYYFHGELSGGSGTRNDQWVWANEEQGLGLNAGLVFLPAEAKVDKKTGSRYEIGADGRAEKNETFKLTLRRVVESDDFPIFVKQIKEIVGQIKLGKEPKLVRQNERLLQQLEPVREQIKQKFSITDDRLVEVLFDYQTIANIERLRNSQEQEDVLDSFLEEALKGKGVLYKEAEHAISSQEYWENYFREHPEQRPSKIVYYQGEDPTSALWEWRMSHGIKKHRQDAKFDFSERHVEKNTPEATAGTDRFRSLAEQIIESRFSQNESISQ